MSKFFIGLILTSFCLVIDQLPALETTLQIRAAALFPASKHFREVYSNVVTDYEIQGSIIYCENYELWANYTWFSKQKKRGDCYRTKITLSDGSFGLNYLFPSCGNFESYLGLGIILGDVKLHNHSCCTSESKSKFAVGGIIKSGVRYYFCSRLFLDGFVDYAYQSVKYHHRRNVGGVKIGGGIGYRF